MPVRRVAVEHEALEDHPNGRRLGLVNDQLAVLDVVAERNEEVARKVLNNSIRVRLINPLKRANVHLKAIGDPIPRFAPKQKVVNVNCGSQATASACLLAAPAAVSNPAQHPSTARGVSFSSAFRGCRRPPRRQTSSQGRGSAGFHPA